MNTPGLRLVIFTPIKKGYSHSRITSSTTTSRPVSKIVNANPEFATRRNIYSNNRSKGFDVLVLFDDGVIVNDDIDPLEVNRLQMNALSV